MRFKTRLLGATFSLACLASGTASANTAYNSLIEELLTPDASDIQAMQDTVEAVKVCLANAAGVASYAELTEQNISGAAVVGCLLQSADSQTWQQISAAVLSIRQCATTIAAETGSLTGSDIRHCLNLNARKNVKTLADAARSARRLMGTAVSEGVLSSGEAQYGALLDEQFDYITPENSGKWGSLQPHSADEWAFENHDSLVTYAQEQDKLYKGHTLVWHSQAPSFINDSLSAAELQELIDQHITTTMSRYAGEIYAWDVVNEAMGDDGNYRDSVFFRKLGKAFIADAFILADTIDPQAKLLYNDYNIAGINAKSNAVYAMLKELVEAGVPVDGIGFQMHLTAANAPGYDELVANFQRFADLGLSVNVSEMDVRLASLPWDRATKLALQRQVYHRVASACAAVAACEAVTTWGFTDNYSWIDSTYAPDDPLQYDEQYQRKPAWYGILDGLMDIAPPALGTMPNLLDNGHFESGFTGWQAKGGTLVREGAAVFDGWNALRVTKRANTSAGASYAVTDVVQPGQTYKVAAQVRRANGPSLADIQLKVSHACADGSSADTLVATVSGAKDKWLALSGSVDLPECELTNVAVSISGPAAKSDLLIDAVSVQPTVLVPDAADLGPNIVQNADFEIDAFGWFGFGSASVDISTATANSGTQSGYVTGRDQSWQGPATSLLLEAMPGAEYQLIAWVRTEEGTAQVNASLKTTCPSGDQYSGIASVSATDSAWSVVSGNFKVANCDFSDLTLYFEGPAGGVNFYIDDVYVRQLPPPDPSSNLIANPGFETGLTGWSSWGGALQLSSDAHTGTQSARLTSRTGTWQGPVYNLLSAVQPGATYNFSAWGKIGGLSSANMNITVKTTCADGTSAYNQAASVGVNDSTWTELAGSLAMPACTLTEVALYFDGPAVEADVYLDDVSVTLAQ